VSKKQDAMTLLKRAMQAIEQSDSHAANDEVIDEESIRELARQDAEQMRRARRR
jgi:hypothetical protein